MSTFITDTCLAHDAPPGGGLDRFAVSGRAGACPGLPWAFYLFSLGACVNLDKPSVLVQCEATRLCQDRGSDADTGAAVQPARDARGTIDSGFGSVTDASGAAVPDADKSGSLDVGSSRDPDVTMVAPSGTCWTSSGPVTAGTVCRASVGSCDVPEVCDGVSATCPDDQYAPPATVCRAARGTCDIAESCTGSSPDCPADAFLTAGAVCRKAAGPCDLAESCSGSSPDCPAESLAPAGTICRQSTDEDQCDPVEICTASSVSCPTDVFYTRPSVPTGVTAAPGTLKATISWSAAAGATGYNVKRSSTSGSGYTTEGAPYAAATSPFVSTGLASGTTYYFVVSAVNTIATCESVNSAEVSVLPSGNCTPPPAPHVTATSLDGQVELTWTASAGVTSCDVARSVNSGTGYVSVATASTANHYTDINLSNGTTYFYVVTASNGSCSSANSTEVSASPTCKPPAAPTNLAANANNGAVALTWTAPAGAISFRILRSRSGDTGYSLVGTSGAASYTDASVTNGVVYSYVVAASNGSCSSANSAPVSAAPACTPPSRPTNLVATPGNAQVALAWVASTGGATSYQVLRSKTAGGPYTTIATPVSAGFTDNSLVNGTTYYYVVNASNGACLSANSAEVSAVPACVPPPVPTIQTATPGDGQVTLSWTASAGAVLYAVQRSAVTGGPYGNLASPTRTSYTDSPLTNGTTYYYVVRANNGACASDPSDEASAKPVAACTQAAPTGVTATAGSKQVALTWAAATGASSYSIGRSTTSGTGYASVGTVAAPTTTFVDTDSALSNGTKYYYVVSAGNGACTSPNSTEVFATPVCVPPAVPTAITATANQSTGAITVSWGTVAAATGYTVSRGTSAAGPFSAVSTNKTAASFTDSGVATGTTYYYVVSASNSGGACSSASSSPAVSAGACSAPSAPSDVTARAGISRVTVSWASSTGGPTSYEVKRATAAGGPFTSLATPTASPYVDSAVSNDTTYYYVVTGRNANGACSSAASAAASAAPRSCTVVSGNVAKGHAGLFNTLAGRCFVTCDTFQGWNCANTGDRSVTINGGPMACGALPVPAPKRAGYTIFDVSAGTIAYSEIYWWGPTFNDTCSIPAGGLDF